MKTLYHEKDLKAGSFLSKHTQDELMQQLNTQKSFFWIR